MADKLPVVIIMAGGTGGHLFPARAVAEELCRRGYAVHWIGTRYGMEKDLVPRWGYDLSFVPMRGVTGKGLRALWQLPFRLCASLFCALRIIWRQRAVAVLGMGGYASVPGSLAAWLLRRPLVLHEQNAVLGWANRLARPLAARCLEGFPDTFPGRAAIFTGSPLCLPDAPGAVPPASAGAGADRPLRLLVLGGSLGARALNQCVPAALALMGSEAPQVWHQTGKRGHEETRQLYASRGVEGRVDAFIDGMDKAYQWADLVVCRAGGATVAELACAGKASVLVPYPWHKDQQQLHNARYLVDRKAAVLLEEAQMTEESLVGIIRTLAADRQQLDAMSAAALASGRPDAARQVADHCLEVAGV